MLTNITRIIIGLMALAVFSVCAILLPELAREEAVGKINPPVVMPYLIAAWVVAAPIFYALYQTLRLLSFIDQNTAFSEQSVQVLQRIKFSAILFTTLIVLGAITIIVVARMVNPTEDVTPVVTLGLVFTFVSSVIATFVAVLQRLLKDAITMKSENELTV